MVRVLRVGAEVRWSAGRADRELDGVRHSAQQLGQAVDEQLGLAAGLGDLAQPGPHLVVLTKSPNKVTNSAATSRPSSLSFSTAPLDLDGVEAQMELLVHPPSFRPTADPSRDPPLTRPKAQVVGLLRSAHETGWEHDTSRRRPVMRQWVLTNLTRYRALIERVGGRSMSGMPRRCSTRRRRWCSTTPPCSRPARWTEELAELIDTAHVFFSRTTVVAGQHVAPPDLRTPGCPLMGHPPFMLRPAGEPPLTLAAVDGLDIVVSRPSRHRSSPRTFDAGFGSPPAPSRRGRPTAFGPDDLDGFIGYVEGSPSRPRPRSSLTG